MASEEVEDAVLRHCRGCDTDKPLNQFNRDRGDPIHGRCYRCRDCSRQRSTRYYAEHREEALRLSDQLRRAKIERHREYCRTWRIRHPEHGYRDRERRRARKLARFIENVDRNVVYEMHGGMCGICKQFIEGKFHVDHVIPLSKGGMHGYVNVQPAHPVCNQRKGAAT